MPAPKPLAPPSTLRLAELLATGVGRLRAAGLEQPEREARALLRWVTALGESRLALALEEAIEPALATRFDAAVARRALGEPFAYVVGEREFWSLSLAVDARVLVPRPETELLVERALAPPEWRSAPARLLDLGTGSGAVALAVASERRDWSVTATDASSDALAVARGNAHRLGLPGVRFLQGSWFAPVAGERFDIVVSNPPYVGSEEEPMLDGGLRFEPHMALTPGPDGLAALRAIVDQAPRHLAAGGLLALEHGATQAAAVRELLEARGFARVVSHRDLAGHERVTEGAWIDGEV